MSPEKQTTGVNDLELGKVNDGVAVGVTAPEIFRAYLFASEMHSEFVREREPGQAYRSAWCVFVIRLSYISDV